MAHTWPPVTHADVEGEINTKLYRRLTKRVITANYTLVAEDGAAEGTEDRVLHVTAGTAVTITLPPDGAPIIPQEIAIPWRQFGAGQITFAADINATVVSRGSAFRSAGQYAEGVVTKVAASTWLVSGDLVP